MAVGSSLVLSEVSGVWDTSCVISVGDELSPGVTSGVVGAS